MMRTLHLALATAPIVSIGATWAPPPARQPNDAVRYGVSADGPTRREASATLHQLVASSPFDPTIDEEFIDASHRVDDLSVDQQMSVVADGVGAAGSLALARRLLRDRSHIYIVAGASAADIAYAAPRRARGSQADSSTPVTMVAGKPLDADLRIESKPGTGITPASTCHCAP
jgi:hypothetical protein